LDELRDDDRRALDLGALDDAPAIDHSEPVELFQDARRLGRVGQDVHHHDPPAWVDGVEAAAAFLSHLLQELVFLVQLFVRHRATLNSSRALPSGHRPVLLARWFRASWKRAAGRRYFRILPIAGHHQVRS